MMPFGRPHNYDLLAIHAVFSNSGTIPACDRRTDRQTDRQTHDDSMYRAVNTNCGAAECIAIILLILQMSVIVKEVDKSVSVYGSCGKNKMAPFTCSVLLLARLMGKYCFARCRLSSSSVGVVCRRL